MDLPLTHLPVSCLAKIQRSQLQLGFELAGSSGGTAALIAARGVTAGFCSDTSGSCRVPASLTGSANFEIHIQANTQNRAKSSTQAAE